MHGSALLLAGAAVSAVRALPSAGSLAQAVLMPQEASNGTIQGFELNTPPPLDAGKRLFLQCRHRLLTYSFGQYTGHPQAAPWSPAYVSECGSPSDWRAVELDISGSSAGRQYDRLGSIWLSGVELWRQDNPEPTPAGVLWKAQKDVSKYFALFAKEGGEVLFDYPNFITPVDNAALNMTLDIVVHVPRSKEGYMGPSPLSERTAELIVPVSHNYTQDNSMFTVGGLGNPPSGNMTIALARNTRSALIEIYASGTAQEEEWYTSIPDDLYGALSDNTTRDLELYPRGPIREVQVRVDGKLAGFVYPMAVIFTGGIAPGMWRPMVSYGAFDQPTYTLDLTAFVPILADGAEHNVSLAVVSTEKNGTINSSWFISGNIQANLDPSGKPTRGKIVHYEGEQLPFSSLATSSHIFGNSSITASLTSRAPRTLRVETLLQVGSETEPQRVRWEQSAEVFANCTVWGEPGSLAQLNEVNTRGYANSAHHEKPFLSYRWDYPLKVSSTGDGTPFEARVHRGYHAHLSMTDHQFGLPAWTHVDNNQQSRGAFNVSSIGRLSSSKGNASQIFAYADANDNTFKRRVQVWSSNATAAVTHDHVEGSLAGYAQPLLLPS